MSEIQDVLEKLYALEATLEITAPIRIGIKKIWPYVPPMNQVVTSTPAFVHDWSMQPLAVNPGVFTESYVVSIKLCVDEVKNERASRIAAAFWPKIRDAFIANNKLGLPDWWMGAVTCTKTTFSDDPTVPSAKTLVGLDINLTLNHKGRADVMAGT